MNSLSITAANTPYTTKTDDRFIKELADMKQNAAFGVNVDDVLTAQSKGKHDEWRELKLQVKRQTFNSKQVFVIIYWAMIFGAFLGVVIMSFVVPGLRWNTNRDTFMNLSIFILAMGISNVISGTQTFAGLKTCTDKKHYSIEPASGQWGNHYIVDEEFIDHECLIDHDCTKGKMLKPGQYGMCQHKVKKIRWISNRAGVVLFVAGVVMCVTSFSTTGHHPSPGDMYQSAVYGTFAGVAQALIFS